MRARRFFALYWTVAPSPCFTTGCPQMRDDNFALVASSSTSGAAGSVDLTPAGPGSNAGAGDGVDAPFAADAGETEDASLEEGAPPIDSPPDSADAAAEGGAPPPSPCLDGSLGPDGATCYHLSSAPATWSDARQACLDAGRLLVQIDSTEEDTFVANSSGSSLWIGASDTAVDGSFVWSDGSPIGFSNWAPEQPDAYAGPDCVEKRQVTDEPWYDQPCDLLKRYVCEAPMD